MPRVFTNIESLELASAKLGTESLQALKGLRLKTLALDQPSIELVRGLKVLSDLESLSLKGFPEAHFDSLPAGTKSLSLDQTKLTARNLGQLAKYKSLKTIVLRNCKVDSDALAAFKTDRPDCDFTNQP